MCPRPAVAMMPPGSATPSRRKGGRRDGTGARFGSALGERHESLRTAFPSERGEPRVEIAATGAIPLRVEEASGLEAALRLAEAEAREPFELGRLPLCRFLLVEIGEGEQVAVVTMHH